jgi:arylsulfatase A-like enzyme/Flp pilus assembly protein TadD
VLVTLDTLRADALGFAGREDVETPVLDRLAAAGRVYTEAHAHNVVTLPSHANLLTGLLPFQHGIRDNSGFVLEESFPTLATLLSAAGYATGAFVGAFPLDRRFGLARGFDEYDDSYPLGSARTSFEIAERRGDEVVAAAIAWWRAQEGRPRFLWVHLYDPHAPYAPPEPFAARYRATPYLGEVAATDFFLGPLLLPHLEGREPPALMIVTADHGEALGDHGEATHGLFAYEPTLKVPLVLWGVGVEPGRDERPARHIDVAPTILDGLAIAPPRRLPGRSLLGPPAAVDTYFESLSTALNRGWAPLRGLLRERRKFIDLPIPELYDLRADPGETHNLAQPNLPALALDLRAALPAESGWPPRNRREPTGEEAARLRSLGYAVGTAPPRSSFGPEDDPKNLVEIDRLLREMVHFYSTGELERAVRIGREIVARRPESGEAYNHLAMALRELERPREAIAVLRRGVERAVVPAPLLRQLGMTLAENGESDEAIAILSAIAEEGDPDVLRSLGSALAERGETERALAILARAEAAAPGDPQVWLAMGVAELRRGRPAEARRHLERALERNDRLAGAWNTLGVALYQLEGPASAIAAWRRATELDPRLWDALYNLGLVAGAAGEREVAREALARFVAGAPPERFAADLAKARAALRELGR